MIPELEAIKQLLLQEWDPIGVFGISGAVDEYDSYAPPILVLMIKGKGPDAIADYLIWVVTDRMGLSGNSEQDRSIAAKLVSLHNMYRCSR